ncbi:hypothetical protein ABIC88_004138 [Pseudomonas kilonensis]
MISTPGALAGWMTERENNSHLVPTVGASLLAIAIELSMHH